MRRIIKKVAVLLFMCAMLFAVASCDRLTRIAEKVEHLSEAMNQFEGDEYIDYPNSKRDEVLDPFVGDQADSSRAIVLMDNVELVYYETDDPYVFEIVIENTNANYFFDGVLKVTRDSEEYNIRVHMLAPRNVEYFTLEVEQDVFDEYYYQPQGHMYEYVDQLEFGYEYMEEWIDSEANEIAFIIDVQNVNSELLSEISEFLYKRDTIYNYYEPNTYYVFTQDQIDANDFDFEFILEVDPSQQNAVVLDDNYRVVRTLRF